MAGLDSGAGFATHLDIVEPTRHRDDVVEGKPCTPKYDGHPRLRRSIINVRRYVV
jgi:hypothetical protein